MSDQPQNATGEVTTSPRISMEEQLSCDSNQGTRTLATMSTTSEMPEERAVDKHVLKRLSTALSLASDSEDEPGISSAEKLSSRNSAPSFEDLKLNTVSRSVSNGFTFSAIQSTATYFTKCVIDY